MPPKDKVEKKISKNWREVTAV